MKKIIILAAILISFNASFAQNAKQTETGNFVALTTATTAKETGKTFTDAKGNVFPVMVSAKGKLFYTKISKTGNKYNVYIKVN